jgi:hypothetical protein
MEEIGPIRNARTAFEKFVAQYPTVGSYGSTDSAGSPSSDFSYLQEYLQGWVEQGDGVEWTGRSFDPTVE